MLQPMKVGDLVDGRYRLLDTLGEGAAGKVFRAEDLGSNRQLIALKLLHAKDPRWEGFFRKEFEILSRLQHPNLVRVYDFGTAPGEHSFYFTQELVIGKPLLDATAGKKVDEVLALFIEVARALEFIHGHAVLHRDLKPANILVQLHAPPGERVRVLDFGLWRELENTPQKAARWAGTPPYLASEVLRGFGHSITADLYAVGITLFQVLTRKLPHGRGTPQELLQQRKQPVPSLYDLGYRPAELSDLLVSLLHEEQSARPQSAAELGGLLTMLVPGTGVVLPALLGRARLVGRQNDQEQLLGWLPQPDRPVQRLVVVNGVDGIGKSRLANELKAEAQLRGHRAAIAMCSEDAAPMHPVADWMRTLAPRSGELSTEQLATLTRLCPDLVELAPKEKPRASSGNAKSAALLIQAIVSSNERRATAAAAASSDSEAEPRPTSSGVVLILEDISRADDQTVAAIEAMVALAAELPLVIVLTDNGDAASQPRWQGVLKRMSDKVILQPLPQEDVGKLLCGLLAVPQVPEAMVETMFAHSAGNPLLIEELLALLVDRGELKRGKKGWELAPFEHPSTVLSVQSIDGRLGKLTTSERQVLTALAVFNRPSGPKLLAAVAGIEVGAVRSALAATANHGLVRVADGEDGRPRIVFRHPHVRDVLVRGLRNRGELASWHRRCAEVLTERAGDVRGAVAETIARHHERAGDIDAAANSYDAASQYSFDHLDFAHAAELGRRTLRLIGDDDALVRGHAEWVTAAGLLCSGRAREGRLHAKLVLDRSPDMAIADAAALVLCAAEAGSLVGPDDDVARHLERLQRHPSLPQSPLARGRLSLARALWLLPTNPKRAWKDCDAACSVLPSGAHGQASYDRALAIATRVQLCMLLGHLDAADADSRALVELADRMDLPGPRLRAQRLRAQVMSLRGDRLESRRLIIEALAMARQVGHHTEEALLQVALGEELWLSGAYAEAVGRYQSAAAAAATLGLSLPRTQSIRMVGRCYFMKGDYDRATGHLRAALEARDVHPHGGDDPVLVRGDLALALLAKNLLDDADVQLHAAIEFAQGAPAHIEASWRTVQGYLDTARSKDTARHAFITAMWLCRGLARDYAFGEAATGLAMWYLRSGDTKRALRAGRMAQRRFRALDAQGQLRRIAPLLNAAEGLVGR